MNVLGEYFGQLADTLTVDNSSISIPAGGIGTDSIGSVAIGEEGSVSRTLFPITLLRTRGNLNVRGNNIQFRYTNSVAGSKIQLNRLGYKVEVLPSITTNLTQKSVNFLTTEDSNILMTEDSNLLIS